MTYFQAVANELQETIDRLRKLHYKVPYEPEIRYGNVYDACGGCMNGWPCQTIKVLDGDPETIKALDDKVQ